MIFNINFKIVFLFFLSLTIKTHAVQYIDSIPITSEEELKIAIMNLEYDYGRIFDIYRFISRNPDKIERPDQIRSLLQNMKHRITWKKNIIHSTDFSQRLKKWVECISSTSRLATLWSAGLALVFSSGTNKEFFESVAALSLNSFVVSLVGLSMIQGYEYLSYDVIDNQAIKNIDMCLDAI